MQQVVAEREEERAAVLGEHVISGSGAVSKLPGHVADDTQNWVALLPP